MYNIWLRWNNRDKRLRMQRERNRETHRTLKGRLMYVRHEEIETDICNIENKNKMSNRHNKNRREGTDTWRRRTRKRRKREVCPHRYTSFVTVTCLLWLVKDLFHFFSIAVHFHCFTVFNSTCITDGALPFLSSFIFFCS